MLMVTVRIGLTDSTSPKVPEFLLVSIDAHWTVLSRFSALTCSETLRVPPMRMSRDSVPFS